VTEYIGDDLTPAVMRVTKGADRKFTLRRHDAGDVAVDWDAEVYISIDIDKTSPTRVDATVVGETADLQIW
jgi:diacylglycerol kinase family enzyme